VANYCFPKTWPADREQRARIISDNITKLPETLAAAGP